MKQPESSLAASRSRRSRSCFTAGSWEWRRIATGRVRPNGGQDRHEAEVELADLARLHRRGRRIVQLRIFRAVSDYARFSVGESLALRCWRSAVAFWYLPRVWAAATLSAE